MAVDASPAMGSNHQPRSGMKMMADRKPGLAKRVHRAKLEAAFTSPYNAALIGCFILGAAFVYSDSKLDIPPWTWAMILLWAIFLATCQVLATYADRTPNAQFLKEMLEDELHVQELRHAEFARQMAVAITYRTNLQTALLAGRHEISGRIASTLARIDDWLVGLGSLARRVDNFKSETAFQSSQMFEHRQRIADLETRAAEATDTKLIGQLRETIAGRRHQLRMVEELDCLLERGQLSIEQAVASLGTVCAQLALVSSNEEDLSSPPSLGPEINREIEQVDAVLAAFERVQGIPRQLESKRPAVYAAWACDGLADQLHGSNSATRLTL